MSAALAPARKSVASLSSPIFCRPAESATLRTARQLLREQSYDPLRHVHLRYQEGVLTLDGIVPTYYLKQLAQTAVRNVAGVESVVNRLQVPTHVSARPT
jgi:osmotically-inducible protein OsmY